MSGEKLNEIYLAAGADALFVEQDFIRKYLTGFYSTDGYVFLDEKGCTFVVDSRYSEAAQKSLAGSGVSVVEGGEKKAQEILEGYEKIALPFRFTSLDRADGLRAKGHLLTDGYPALKEAMEIKSPEELALIQQACDVAEEAFLALLPQIKEGMTENAVAALLEYEMRKRGASGTSFDTIVAFGANGSVPHHETGNTVLKFGDAVLVDFGCKIEGYCSDCTRTFLFGDDKRHEEFKRIYAHVLAAHELVKEKTVAGMTGREADEIARGYLRAQGLDGYFTHSLGHGIGLQIHEYPLLAPRGEEVLRDGMVFSDEPGVYMAGKLGIRIEDSVQMKDGKVFSFMKKTNGNLIIL